MSKVTLSFRVPLVVVGVHVDLWVMAKSVLHQHLPLLAYVQIMSAILSPRVPNTKIALSIALAHQDLQDPGLEVTVVCLPMILADVL